MTCKEVRSRKYQTRKSPPFHAGDCKGLTKAGKDGDYISKADRRGVYKWVKGSGSGSGSRKTEKAAKPVGDSYMIHDNGNQPFKVQLSGPTVTVFKAKPMGGDLAWATYDQQILKVKAAAVYIGECPDDPAMRISLCSKFDKGNSILLHLAGDRYMFIGSTIYEFTMEDTVTAYYSAIGPNDVPYPVLVGSENVYFMLDKKYVPRSVFVGPMTAGEWADAYSYYYGYKNPKTCVAVENKRPTMKGRPMKSVKQVQARL